MAYNGNIAIAAGFIQKNGQNYPLVDASAVNIDNFDTRLNQILDKYAESTTEGTTAVKVATIKDNNSEHPAFKLYKGLFASVNFTNANTANNPKLNIQDTGEHPIKYRGMVIESDLLSPDAPPSLLQGLCVFVFDGNTDNPTGGYWHLVGGGGSFSNERSGFAIASGTVSGTQLTVSTADGLYKKVHGGYVYVTLTNNTGVPANCKLKIDTGTAGNIKYLGANITAGIIKGEDSALLVCDNNDYILIWCKSWGEIIDDDTISIGRIGNIGTQSYAVGNDVEASGDYSHAEGVLSKAYDEASHAEGYSTHAVGIYSHAEGQIVSAVGAHSHAEGSQTVAQGGDSHAEGSYSKAIGGSSHAEGSTTEASGEYGSHSEGQYTKASGNSSHAEGFRTVASGLYSHAEGERAVASGQASHAEGTYSYAYGSDSHAQGNNIIAAGPNTFAFGQNNIPVKASAPSWKPNTDYKFGCYTKNGDNYYICNTQHTSGETFDDDSSNWNPIDPLDNNYLEIVGNGSNNNNRSNARTLSKTGDEWIAGNFINDGNISAKGGITLNSDNDSSGYISMGRRANSTVGKNSFAQGVAVIASGVYSHAEGTGTEATNTDAHAEGSASIASGETSHAEGNNTRAKGRYSHSEGSNTIASGDSQHVFGTYNIENVYPIWTENTLYRVGQRVDYRDYLGWDSGYYECLVENSDATFTKSKWKYISGPNSNYVEIVGNGNSEQSRSNARTLDWSGNEWLAGGLATNGDLSTKGGIILNSDNNTTGYISMGRKPDTTVGINSVATGSTVEASGNYSHAEGSGTAARGLDSHAEGFNSLASGKGAHAEGSEGSTASKEAAHAEGYATTASGDAAHAEGVNTTASGDGSHAEGLWTVASKDYQHVSGKYNVEDTTVEHAEIVGNGTLANPSNARMLDWHGNEWLAGSLETEENVEVKGNLIVAGESHLTGELTAKEVTINDGLTVNNTAEFNQAVNIHAATTVDGKLTAQNDVSVEGKLIVNDTTTLTGKLTANGDAQFSGTVTAPTVASTDNSTNVATTAFVKSAFSQMDAIVYKGVLHGGEPTTYTPAASKGETYRVATAGKINGVVLEVGDMLTCNTDNTPAGTSSNVSTVKDKWDYIQSNIDGAVVNTTGAASTNIPIFDGNTGKVIKDSGKKFSSTIPYHNLVTDTDVPTVAAVENYIVAWFDYKQIAVNSLTVNTLSVSPAASENGNLVEKGSTVSRIKLTYSLNKDATEMKLDNVSTKNDSDTMSASGTITKDISLSNTNKAWSLYVEDTRPDGSHKNASRSVTLKFVNRVFYGAATIPNTVNNAFVRGLANKPLDEDGIVSGISVTTGENEYIWYCSTKSNCKFNVGGFDGGFNEPIEVQVKDAGNVDTTYYVYRSTNSNLGTKTITVK